MRYLKCLPGGQAITRNFVSPCIPKQKVKGRYAVRRKHATRDPSQQALQALLFAARTRGYESFGSDRQRYASDLTDKDKHIRIKIF